MTSNMRFCLQTQYMRYPSCTESFLSFHISIRCVLSNLKYLCYGLPQVNIPCTSVGVSCLSYPRNGFWKPFSLHIMFSSLLFLCDYSCERFCIVLTARNAVFIAMALYIYVMCFFSEVCLSGPHLFIVLLWTCIGGGQFSL
jgi:hypothetical protein